MVFRMTKDTNNTMRSRELAEALRAVMKAAGYNGKLLAQELGWAEPRMSRLLTGQLAATLGEVSAFLAVCRVIGRERDRLMALVPDLTTPGWHQQFGPRLPEDVHTLMEHESKCSDITEFEPVIIPGLLQTGDYAQEVISAAANVSANEVDSWVDARLGRQGILGGEQPPDFTFYIDEFVLRRPIGGPVVMSGQLHHLLRISVRDNINIRIIPASVGAHAGFTGACRLMESHAFSPVAYLEGEASNHFLEEPAEIIAYRNLFNALDRVALNEADSRELLRSCAELYGEDPDDFD
jgi:hypothetical protein